MSHKKFNREHKNDQQDEPKNAQPAQEETQEQANLLEAEVERLQAELAEMKDRWMRSEAEKQNIVNRAARDLQDAHKFGLQKFSAEIVDGAENIGRAIAALPKEDASELLTKIREGLETAERSFLGVLERHGITRVEAKGEQFDANLHQAMQEIDSPDHKPGQVVEAWTPAWKLHDRLIKPAMVVVASKNSGGKA